MVIVRTANWTWKETESERVFILLQRVYLGDGGISSSFERVFSLQKRARECFRVFVLQRARESLYFKVFVLQSLCSSESESTSTFCEQESRECSCFCEEYTLVLRFLSKFYRGGGSSLWDNDNDCK